VPHYLHGSAFEKSIAEDDFLIGYSDFLTLSD